MPVFVEDIVMDPGIKRRDVSATRPEKEDPTRREPNPQTESGTCSRPKEGPPKIFPRIAKWAENSTRQCRNHSSSAAPPSKIIANARNNTPSAICGRLKEGPRATLSFGSVMHTTIKRFLEQLKKGAMLPFEEVQHIYETEWSSAGYEDEYQEAEYKKDGLEQLKTFYAAMLQAPPKSSSRKKRFELPLENDVILTGRMDQVNSLGRKDVEIVDYKTGKPKKEADARKICSSASTPWRQKKFSSGIPSAWSFITCRTTRSR